jgi:hypothetical protein
MHYRSVVAGRFAMSMSNPEFDARIARITSGMGSSKSTIYVGLDEVYQVTYQRRGKAKGAVATVNKAIMPVFMLIALGAGVLAYAIARWIQFSMYDLQAMSSDPLSNMGYQAGAALAVALVLNLALQFRARVLKLMLAVGAISSTVLFHNAVHIRPDTFAQVFSPGWVEQVTSSTKPQSVMWMGKSFTF